MKARTLRITDIITGSLLASSFFLILFVLGSFSFLSVAQAFLPSPTPDGGYPGLNTAEGDGALFNLTTGNSNTAVGQEALYDNETGDDNTATGTQALFANTMGSFNTANGAGALHENSTGNFNTANGAGALVANRSGNNNTATGYRALWFSTSSLNNTANGSQALFNNKSGSNNTAEGSQALANLIAGSSNIAIGDNAGLNLIRSNNNIDIGNQGVNGDAGKIRIGTKGTHNGTYIAGISGTAVTGSTMVVNANGRLGVATSSARFKKAIKPMDKTSEAVLALKPVTFQYNENIDPNGIPQFGLIAEEVEKVDPDLVGRDENGKVNTVRYEAVNAMLLNEFLKEHRTVQALKRAVARQQNQIEALTATLQKVSTENELNKSTAKTAATNQ